MRVTPVQDFYHREGNWPSDTAVASHLGWNLEKVQRVRQNWSAWQQRPPARDTSEDDTTSGDLWDRSRQDWDGQRRPLDPTAAAVAHAQVDTPRLQAVLAMLYPKQRTLLTLLANHLEAEEQPTDDQMARTLGTKRPGVTRLRERLQINLRESLTELRQKEGDDEVLNLLRHLLDHLVHIREPRQEGAN